MSTVLHSHPDARSVTRSGAAYAAFPVRLRPLAVAAILICTASAAPADKDYKIRLTWEQAPGDVYAVTIKARVRSVSMMRMAGDEPRITEDYLELQAEGRLKVIAVDDAGGVTRCDFVVGSFVQDGRATFPAGTSIAAETTAAGQAITVNGKPVAPDSVESCKIITAPFDGGRGRTGNDALFGSRLRRHVGEAWSGDADAIASLFGGDSNVVKREDVTGTATLVSVEMVDGKPAPRVQIGLRIDKLKGNGDHPVKVDAGRIAVGLDIISFQDDKSCPASVFERVQSCYMTRGTTPDGKAFTDDKARDQEITRTYRKQVGPVGDGNPGDRR